MRVAAYDAAPPRVRAFIVPATGRTGEPLGFAVSAVDAWSPPVTAQWALGDGRTAAGLTPTVTYGRAGSYAVTATVTDARALSATTAPGPVEITGADVPLPPAPTPLAPSRPPPASDPAPVISGLAPVRRCVRRARLDATATRGALAFRFTLTEPARVTFSVRRRRESRPRLRCPQRITGTQPGTVQPIADIPRDAPAGTNQAVLGRASIARRPVAATRARAGGNHVRLAAAPGGRALRPGTYIVIARATDAAGQRSGDLRAKFWVLLPGR